MSFNYCPSPSKMKQKLHVYMIMSLFWNWKVNEDSLIAGLLSLSIPTKKQWTMKSNCSTRNWFVVPEEAIGILQYWNHKMFQVIRQAGKKTEGKQSILASSTLAIQDRIIQKCGSSAIQKSVKLLLVVNIPRVYASCIWK